MQIVQCSTSNLNQYFKFIKDLYQGNPYYRASMVPTMRGILTGKSAFSKDKYIQPLLIIDEIPQAVATLIWSDQAPDMIMVAFFESLNNPGTVPIIIEEASRAGKERGAKQIVFGINGHPNYGLGILSRGFDLPMSFGNAWNPGYYDTLLSAHATNFSELDTYQKGMGQFAKEFSSLKLPEKSAGLNIRYIDLSNLASESVIYNSLSNAAFAKHPFYFHRQVAEDYEMLEMFKPILRPENLLIAEIAGKPVGYLLWYPDFNELIPAGGRIGLIAYLKNKFSSASVRSFRGAQVAVLPEYQRSGIGINLMAACYKETKNKFETCETGWVVDTNISSKGMINKWSQDKIKPLKSYKVYSVNI